MASQEPTLFRQAAIRLAPENEGRPGAIAA